MIRRRPRLRFALAAVPILLVISLTGILSTPRAHAQWGVCFDDPVVFLSNHVRVDLETTILTDQANVSGIEYVLTVPAGVAVDHVVYQGNHTQNFVSLALVNDAGSSNTYDLSTSSQTTSSVPMWAELGVGQRSRAARAFGSGFSNADPILLSVQY